jgi:AraC-like DNA-binding protein
MRTFAPMYGQQSIHDFLFLMLYGGVAMLALAAGFYLWLRRSNAIAPEVVPPTVLRWWTAAFFITAALSHVWWYVLGVYWLTDDRLVRNITAVTLDHITLVPLVMAMLLRLLQDRQRRFWPWVLTQVPIVVAAVIGIVRHDEFYGIEMTTYWQLAVMIVFVVYYIYSLVKYGRWLHENYADLEHKEVWQSLLFVVVLFVIYEAYSTNPGEMAKEYLAQVNTIVIIGFLLWRVETLQTLSPITLDLVTDENEETQKGINIGALLEQHCEARQLYLQHDLTLQQLATIIGTNRTYLSGYFAQQGITYNAYINRLRVEHFIRLYRKNNVSSRPITAIQLAQQSGFSSYSTFSVAFKKNMCVTVSEWMRSEES